MIFGSKTYELSLTRNYVSSWECKHAIRELIQNALDSESPFEYEFSGQGEEQSLALTSEFTVLLPATLLLGSTSKTGDKDAIGSFGEGYKIALLVLTRNGYDVEIWNGDKLWKPSFRHNSKFNQELLVVTETQLPHANTGLKFIVSGLSEEDVTDIRATCLKMQDDIGQIHSTPKGDILLDRPNKLYVGGLLICDTELAYSYNIKPEFIKLERDRSTVSTWDLKSVTCEMWYATKLFDQIALMIKNEVPDLEYAEYSSPDMVKEACYRLFMTENPKGIIAKSQEQLESMVKQGMPKQEVRVYGGAYYSTVSSYSSYRDRPIDYTPVKTPMNLLQAWYDKHHYNMADSIKQSFKDLIATSINWKL